ncbi:synaptotagmin-4 [Nematostella vectensis]|uniref:synaptotagmin-4 n=1 Tax=Nematostella vectensis TaxID=45351 RepID=UPI001390088F|nr:synaptotagmin-4 [Nematostella vectensis]
MTDTASLGIVLGAVLGFLFGAVAVCVSFLCYRRHAKGSYDTHDVDGRRRTIEYYSGTPQGYLPPAHTRPYPVQPNIYRLTKKSEEEATECEDGSREDDGERVRITDPYDSSVVEELAEGETDRDTIADLDTSTPTKAKKPKKPLLKQFSLPAKIGQLSEDLVHHSPEKFIRDKQTEMQECVLEISLFYDTASKELHITVINVSGIPTSDETFLRPPNCSVKMRILPEMLHWQWTRKVSRTLNPVFNETFIVPGFVHNKLRECTAHFVVLDFDHIQDNVYVIGEVFMPLSELRANRLEKIVKRVNPLSF